MADQQAALATNDPDVIVPSSRHLAALALQLSGALYRAHDQTALAAAAFTRALAAEDAPSVRQQLLATYLLAKAPADASRVEADILRSSGDTPQTRLLIASACHTADDLTCTITQLTAAVRLAPDSAAAHLALGNAYWEHNEYQYNDDSLQQFTAAQRLDPVAYQSNYDLGAMLSQYQRYSESEAPLHAATKAEPASPDPWLQLGMNAFAQGRDSEARPLLEKAIELTGTDLAHNQYQVRRAFVALSRILAQTDPARAADYAARDAAIHTVMAQSSNAPALSQSTGLVTNSTAQGRADAPSEAPGKTTDTSAQTEQQLTELATQSLNDAGTALARTRDYAGALPLFRLAAEIDPQLPPVLRNLGLAAFHTGNMDEAAHALRTWLQTNPADALAQRYLQQIVATPPPAAAQP